MGARTIGRSVALATWVAWMAMAEGAEFVDQLPLPATAGPTQVKTLEICLRDGCTVEELRSTYHPAMTGEAWERLAGALRAAPSTRPLKSLEECLNGTCTVVELTALYHPAMTATAFQALARELARFVTPLKRLDECSAAQCTSEELNEIYHPAMDAEAFERLARELRAAREPEPVAEPAVPPGF